MFYSAVLRAGSRANARALKHGLAIARWEGDDGEMEKARGLGETGEDSVAIFVSEDGTPTVASRAYHQRKAGQRP
jgi:mevalonate pyrophosphate decarboxylase